MLEAVIILAVVLLIAWAIWKSINKAKTGGGCCPEHEETVKRIQVADRNKKHYPYLVSLDIRGMTCDNCARRVENALNELDGIWASVDIASHKAKVRCKQKPDQEKISEAVMNAGYIVTNMTSQK